MSADTQVNVRLTVEELNTLDALRRAGGAEVSRAEVLRSLLREKRRTLVDQRIAEAYDAAAWGDDDVAESSAVVAGGTLQSL
jgi:Arc/MetJ-type ribon-helix-helix transcriptional regulator